ncbi:methionyl-tRNA formyltransferase [Micavibrio aeruginosavorus]|uniref:methionyl-tRNA formyltransferase n=1 Tax=Micavibrio aeruginosavorus TaxID=349221 RepID=UPI003F4AC16A
MNVVFIGASKFGQRCLETILQISAVNVVGVVTAPQKFSISYNKDGVTNVLYANVADLCKKNNLPLETISAGMKDENLFSCVQQWAPDIFIVSGWYHILPRKWRDLAPAYGLHASLLPSYSGGAPLVWAMINGEKETGITLFQFDDGVDSGPILGQGRTDIYKDDTIATLYDRIESIGIELLQKALPELAGGTANFIVQDDTNRTTFPQRSPSDGLINWDQDVNAIHNFVRAQTKPYPGAFTFNRGKKITIWAGAPSEKNCFDDSVPGKIFSKDNEIFVNCGHGSVYQMLSISVDGSDMDIECFISNFNNEECLEYGA